VVQICYRTADLGFLLKRDGEPLSKYSQDLRAEPGICHWMMTHRQPFLPLSPGLPHIIPGMDCIHCTHTPPRAEFRLRACISFSNRAKFISHTWVLASC